jgi:3-methylcrotonyl-CoA carboxylase alpha subunit
MRRVNAAAEFQEMLLSCKREAASSFGDDRVLIEKYVERPRHIEVQVFGDTHGNVVHLFERDCSLQRRHQKVIEEAPAPGMDEGTREAVCAAAVKAALAVDYVGAGTIEFIADASEGLRADRIWFMEMNTRLQVEHPVTEEITGVDLVEWQLRVASGEELPLRQEELRINGWAMEARLYAEDPTTGFLPSTGKLERFWLGYAADYPGAPRIDTGVEQGSEISPFYDPMIAKLIVHHEDRRSAAKALSEVTAGASVWPVKTNAAFLTALLEDEIFIGGDVDTGFIARDLDRLTQVAEPNADAVLQAASLLMADTQRKSVFPIDSPTPWLVPTGFRLNAAPRSAMFLSVGGERVETDAQAAAERPYREIGGAVFSGQVTPIDAGVLITDRGATHLVTQYRPSGAAAGAASDGALISPMPGKIIAVEVRQGDVVAKGQKLVTLEAMKMEHSLTAPFDGVVAELSAVTGGQVSEGALLARIEKGESE